MIRSFINSLSSSKSYLHEAGKQLVSQVSNMSYSTCIFTNIIIPVLECLAVHNDEHSGTLFT